MASVTIIACPAVDPDQFEAMTLKERRERSAGWKTFPLRTGVRLCTFVMMATHHDFGVFGSPGECDGDEALDSNAIFDGTHCDDLVTTLERLVETERDITAQALFVHGGATGDIARITEALRTGELPATADWAEESAAFAYHLLAYGRTARELGFGVCWEYRGDVRGLLATKPTALRRELQTLYSKLRDSYGMAGFYDLWEHGGRSSATDAQIAEMDRDLADAQRVAAETKAAVTAFVARLRTENPAELDGWAFAHYCYLSQYIHQCAERGDSSAAERAVRARAEWAELRAGTRDFVDEPMVPILDHFYQAYFGIDPRTGAAVTVDRD